MSQFTRFPLGTGAAPIEYIDIGGASHILPSGTGGVTFGSPNETIVLTQAANTVYFDVTEPNRMGFGLDSWSGGAPYLDYTTTIGSVTINNGADIWFTSKLMPVSGPQTVTGLTSGKAYWIYYDATGTLQATEFAIDIIVGLGAIMYCVYRDTTPGTNKQYSGIVEQNPYYNVTATQALEIYNLSKIVKTSGSGVITATGGNQITLSEAVDIINPFYIFTVLDPGGAARTFNIMYATAGGLATSTRSNTFSAVYNNFGVGPTALTAGYYGVYTLYIGPPDGNTSAIQYFAIMNRDEYSTEQEALFAISRYNIDGSGALGAIGLVRAGFIVVSQATGNISRVIVDEDSTTGIKNNTSTRDAIMLPTYTANFSGLLGATDTTVQAALDTIDDMVVDVPHGGTGVSSITDHAVMVGSGTGNITSIGPGTSGQLLIGKSSDDPVWAVPTNGNNITWVTGAGTLKANVTGCTQYALQVGNATNSLDSLATGSANQVLQSGGGGANPAWSSTEYPATSATGNIIYASAANTYSNLAFNSTATRYLANTGGGATVPAWDQINLTNGVTGVLPIANGGTGVSSITAHNLLVGDGTNPINEIANGSDGQVLIAAGSADAAFASLTSTGGTVVFNTGANALNLETAGKVATSYAADTGSATPAAGTITFAGGNNIGTSGAGSTITINVNGTTDHAVQVGNSANSLTSLGVGSTGQGLMGNSSADPSWEGSPSFNGTVTGGTGLTATTGDVTVSAGLVALPTTSSTAGQITINGARWVHSYGTRNTFVGENAGNFSLTTASADDNVGIGCIALNSIRDGNDNCSIGAYSLRSCRDGNSNTVIGREAAYSLQDGSNNTILGRSGMKNIVSGAYNCTLGYQAGDNCSTGSESSNIYINHRGVASESNTMRLGRQGSGNQQVDTTYIAGIYNVSVGSTHKKMVIDNNHQVGTLKQAIFLAYNSANRSNTTGSGTSYTVEFDTEVYDLGGNYDNATNYDFTAPVTGKYLFTSAVRVEDLDTTMRTGRIQLVTTNRRYKIYGNPADMETYTGGLYSFFISVIADLNAGDQALIQIQIDGWSSDIATVSGDSSDAFTYFSGELLL